jgi:hypothetical protein
VKRKYNEGVAWVPLEVLKSKQVDSNPIIHLTSIHSNSHSKQSQQKKEKEKSFKSTGE